MDIVYLDQDFNRVKIIDEYESFIWTDRFQEAGDFELVMTADVLDWIEKENYLVVDGTEHAMIIETIETTGDVESGNRVTISGRSIESILDRRIIWSQTVLDGYLEGQIKKLLTQNVISPTDTARKIDNFVFKESGDDYISTLTIRAQYTGDNLYDTIQAICTEAKIGWKLILNDKNQFEFSLFSGKDRSYDQEELPCVVFAPNFDNLVDSNYIESNNSIKNIALVGGEGEGSDRRMATYYKNDEQPTGLNRREDFVDARDISSKVTNEDGTERTLTDEEYLAELIERGKENIVDYNAIQTFESGMDYNTTFIFNKDYFLGDICQVVNEFGISSKVRVVEMVVTHDTNGQLIYPTFTSVE